MWEKKLRFVLLILCMLMVSILRYLSFSFYLGWMTEYLIRRKNNLRRIPKSNDRCIFRSYCPLAVQCNWKGHTARMKEKRKKEKSINSVTTSEHRGVYKSIKLEFLWKNIILEFWNAEQNKMKFLSIKRVI